MLLLNFNHLLSIFDAAVIYFMHVIIEIFMSQLRSYFIHLLLLLPQSIRIHNIAMLAMHTPMLQLMFAGTIGRPFALPAHEKGLLPAVLTILQCHY